MVPIETHFLTQNDCYQAQRTILPKGIMVHSTGVAQSNPMVFLQSWNRPGVEVCVHALVSENRIIQTLPWEHRGWHAGTGTTGRSANNTHISFEICEDSLADASYFEAVYQKAVELTAYLCGLYNLDPLEDGVVICHSEGYQRGIASNHADVMHWFPKFGKYMDLFRADVDKILKGEDTLTQEQFNQMMDVYLAERNAKPASPWAVPYIQEAIDAGVMSDMDGSIQSPQGFVSREELATVAAALAKK